MRWFLWLAAGAALFVAFLSALGPIALAILSLVWPGILGGWLSILCGGTVAVAVLAAEDFWWRRAAFGLPALAGTALLAAWEPFLLWFAASGAGLAVWDIFKGLPSWIVGERPPAS